MEQRRSPPAPRVAWMPACLMRAMLRSRHMHWCAARFWTPVGDAVRCGCGFRARWARALARAWRLGLPPLWAMSRQRARGRQHCPLASQRGVRAPVADEANRPALSRLLGFWRWDGLSPPSARFAAALQRPLLRWRGDPASLSLGCPFGPGRMPPQSRRLRLRCGSSSERSSRGLALRARWPQS